MPGQELLASVAIAPTSPLQQGIGVVVVVVALAFTFPVAVAASVSVSVSIVWRRHDHDCGNLVVRRVLLLSPHADPASGQENVEISGILGLLCSNMRPTQYKYQSATTMGCFVIELVDQTSLLILLGELWL
jgi:hypothetical protein